MMRTQFTYAAAPAVERLEHRRLFATIGQSSPNLTISNPVGDLLVETTSVSGQIRVTDDIRYQFRPGTPALHQAALACIEAYRADPNGVARLLVNRGQGLGQRSIPDSADGFGQASDDEREPQR